jgi:hypothetical protein
MKDLKYLLQALTQQPHRKHDQKTDQWESDTDFLQRLLNWLYSYDFEGEARLILKEIEKEVKA